MKVREIGSKDVYWMHLVQNRDEMRAAVYLRIS
jgi:hypothetical protein